MKRVSSATKNPTEMAAVSQSVSQSRTKKKAPKGTVVVQVFKDRLRLCWSYLGKRYYLYIGLPDSKINRTVAEGKARWIEGDVATGNFDSTLKKYKSESQLKRSQVSIVKLFQQFTQEKAKGVYPRTLEKYRATLNYLSEYFQNKPVELVDIPTAELFTNWLSERNRSRMLKERLGLLNACWIWAQKQGLVESNPWSELGSRVKVAPRQAAKPFSREEIGAIILGFRSDRYYHHYADYVEFLFGTGCRTGEAIGLRWQHLSEDCSTVWIGESLSRGVRKATKTNKSRTIALTPKLQAMLLARRPAKFDPDGLVFISSKGGAIDDHNFRNRAWRTVLTRLEIDYRKPYTTRHTLISHALDLGMNPVNVAQLTGHDVQVLYQNYAGNVNSRPMLPEL